MIKVACFSVACVDSYPQFSLRFPGGNALNQSVRFRELGCETLFAGAVGGDEAGERIGDLLRAHGVDMSAFHFLMAEKTASTNWWWMLRASVRGFPEPGRVALMGSTGCRRKIGITS